MLMLRPLNALNNIKESLIDQFCLLNTVNFKAVMHIWSRASSRTNPFASLIDVAFESDINWWSISRGADSRWIWPKAKYAHRVYTTRREIPTSARHMNKIERQKMYFCPFLSSFGTCRKKKSF